MPTEDTQTSGWDVLTLLFFPCYFLSHIIIYAILRTCYQPQDLGGFGTVTSSLIDRFRAAYTGFVTSEEVASGSSSEFQPEHEVSLPSYYALNQYDIVSTSNKLLV
jgi:hypothetical protein